MVWISRCWEFNPIPGGYIVILPLGHPEWISNTLSIPNCFHCRVGIVCGQTSVLLPLCGAKNTPQFSIISLFSVCMAKWAESVYMDIVTRDYMDAFHAIHSGPKMVGGVSEWLFVTFRWWPFSPILLSTQKQPIEKCTQSNRVICGGMRDVWADG